jgi:AbrB family looped-hinge helix DNA binding protein
MAAVKILAKGQVVIPAGLSRKYHMKPGTEIQILEYGGTLYLVPPVADPIKAACGFLPKRPSLARELLKERRKAFQDPTAGDLNA